MVDEAKKWWGDWEEETQWLEGAESKMADLRPLAGGVPLIKTQKEENEVYIYMQYLCVFVNRSTYTIRFAYKCTWPPKGSVTSVIRRKSSFCRARRFVGSLASRAVSRARARAASVGLFTHWLAGARQNMRNS